MCVAKEYCTQFLLVNRQPLDSSELFHVLKGIKQQTRQKITNDYTYIEFYYKDTKRKCKLLMSADGTIDLAMGVGEHEVIDTGEFNIIRRYVQKKIVQACENSLRPHSTLPAFPEGYTYGFRHRDYSFLSKPSNPVTNESQPKSNGSPRQISLDEIVT